MAVEAVALAAGRRVGGGYAHAAVEVARGGADARAPVGRAVGDGDVDDGGFAGRRVRFGLEVGAQDAEVGVAAVQVGEVVVEVAGRGDVGPRVEALQRAKDRLVAAERHPVVVARQGVVPVRVREVPAPAARPPGDCRYRQAEADLQRGAEGGRPEAEGRSGRGEGASGEADPGGGERALAGRGRAEERTRVRPRGVGTYFNTFSRYMVFRNTTFCD